MARTRSALNDEPERALTEADKADRLLSVAREIIRERRDFDLGMRDLAARARVSLRLPYELFGSKAGVISAILKSEQAEWAVSLIERKARGDAFDEHFRLLKLGLAWFEREEAFYRALFQASQAYSEGDEADASRENQPIFARWARRAIREGLIETSTDPDVLAGALTDVFAANLRVWALTGCDLRLVEARIAYGYALLLGAVATEPHALRMRKKAQEMQAAVTRRTRGRPPSAGAGGAPDPPSRTVPGV